MADLLDDESTVLIKTLHRPPESLRYHQLIVPAQAVEFDLCRLARRSRQTARRSTVAPWPWTRLAVTGGSRGSEILSSGSNAQTGAEENLLHRGTAVPRSSP
jgi:hypothetical protein